MTTTGVAILSLLVTIGLALAGALAAIWGKLKAIEAVVTGMTKHCDRERERYHHFGKQLGDHAQRIGVLEVAKQHGGGE